MAREYEGRVGGTSAVEQDVEGAAPSPGRSTLVEGAEGGAGAEVAREEPVGDLSADRVGQTVDEGDDVVADVADKNPPSAKQEIAAKGGELPEQGGAAEVQGGGLKPEADATVDTDPVSPEVAASIEGAQSDTREAMADAEAQSAAYKAEMKEQRDRFDAEQNATMLEQVKAMSSADKRSTLLEMGYDKKAVKKMKDAELASIIEGKMSSEARKTRILGMDPEELAALGTDRKIQYLVDLGIDRKDLDKVGPQKAAKLFDDIMKVAHVPGQHKVKIKIKGGLLGKSWEVTVKCDAEGNTDVSAQKKGGFLSKLWGWVKLALPIILTVLAPLTAGASLIVLAVYQTATAIASGNWLGAIIGVAGALIGVGALMAAKGAASAASTIAKVADVAKKVQKVAETAQQAMNAAKAKNAGSLLAVLSSGAASFAGFAAKSAQKFSDTMTRWSERLKKWSGVVTGGQKVIKGIKSGDPLAAIGGAFDTVGAAMDSKSGTAKQLQRASAVTGFANAGRRALASNPPNYGLVADAAFSIAGQLTTDRRIDDAARIVSSANRLKQAWDQRETNPAALAEAALGLATAIQVAKYDAQNEETKDADGKVIPDASREAVLTKYQRATTIVRVAGAALTAATQKPRPNYLGALDAATQLIAEFTADKRLDAAAVVTSRLDAWTRAIGSKDERAILEAGLELGKSINGLRTEIESARDKAKIEAAKTLGAGEVLDDDGGTLPAGPGVTDLTELPGEQVGVPVPLATPVAPQPPDPLRFEEEITVRPEGSEPTPRFSEEITVRPAPAGGINVRVPATPAAPAQPASGNRTIEPPVALIISLVKGFAAVAKDNGSPALAQGIAAYESAVKTIEDWVSGRGTLEPYNAAVSTLKTAKETLKFQQLFFNEWNRYAPQLGNGLNVPRATVQAYGRMARNLGRVARIAGIPESINTIADDIIVACGYNKDLSGAEVGVVDRIAATVKLVRDVASFGRDLAWVRAMATAISATLGSSSATAAINMVRYKVNTFGDDIARVVMEYMTPILNNIATKHGGAEALRAAQRVVGVFTAWGPEFKAVTNSIGFKAVTKTLAPRLLTVLKLTLGWELAIAYEIAKLEAQFAAQLYADCYAGLSMILSANMFGGKMANALKREISSKPIGTVRECQTFFRYAFNNQMLTTGTLYEIRGRWLPHARRKVVGLGPTFDSAFANTVDPVSLLDPLPDGLIQLGAYKLQDAALSYVNDEYRRVFGQDP